MPRWPKKSEKKPEKSLEKPVEVGPARPAPQIGTVYLLAKFDERFDHIDRRLRKIMATNNELQAQVQKLQMANTAQTALIQAEHNEVMAKLDEIAAAGSIDQTVFDNLKGEIDKVSANNDAIKDILPPDPAVTPAV